MTEPSESLVEGLFARPRIGLQAFFFRRLRTKVDAADLAQEVHLRISRVNGPDTILNPEAYLFAVAGNLLKENVVADRRPAASSTAHGEQSVRQLPAGSVLHLNADSA